MENLVSLIADLLLLAAAIGAAGYCIVLSRRLTRLNSIDKGLGGAIAVLSVQVDDLTKALEDARNGSEATAERLATLMSEAEKMANDIEDILSVSHDFVPPADAQVAPGEPEEDAPLDVPLFLRRSVLQEAAE